MVVLGSDGIYDFLSDQQIINIVYRHYTVEGGVASGAAEAARAVLEAAKSEWSKVRSGAYRDDMTCIVYLRAPNDEDAKENRGYQCQ